MSEPLDVTRSEVLLQVLERPYDLTLYEHCHSLGIPLHIASVVALTGIAEEKALLARWQMENALAQWRADVPTPEPPR